MTFGFDQSVIAVYGLLGRICSGYERVNFGDGQREGKGAVYLTVTQQCDVFGECDFGHSQPERLITTSAE